MHHVLSVEILVPQMFAFVTAFTKIKGFKERKGISWSNTRAHLSFHHLFKYQSEICNLFRRYRAEGNLGVKGHWAKVKGP
jgi:hypothetical protein